MLKKLASLCTFFMLVLMVTVSGVQAAPLAQTHMYTLTPLSVPAGFTATEANGINENGQIVGTATSSNGVTHAIIWDSSGRVVQNLGTFENRPTIGFAINDDGVVAGTGVGNFFANPNVALVWDATNGWQMLHNPPNEVLSIAFAINNARQVAGSSGFVQRAVLWDSAGNPQLIGSLGSGDFGGTALGINTSGQVTGFASLNSGGFPVHGFLWTPEAGMRDLGTLSTYQFARSEGIAINDLGHIAGSVDIDIDRFTNIGVPGLWHDGRWTVLRRRAGSALAINNQGEIVGTFSPNSDTSFRAFIYHDGRFTNLNRLIVSRNTTLTEATGINEQGLIVANSDVGGAARAFVLTPR
jgi:probable HAF family extracellular repeat protein